MSSQRSNDHYPSVSVLHDGSQTSVPCTRASDAAWRAAENLGIEIGRHSYASLALQGAPLLEDEELVDGQEYDLILSPAEGAVVGAEQPDLMVALAESLEICGATWAEDPTLVCMRPTGHRGGHSYQDPPIGYGTGGVIDAELARRMSANIDVNGELR